MNKYILFVFVCTVYLASSVPVEEPEKMQDPYPRNMQDFDGNTIDVERKTEPNIEPEVLDASKIKQQQNNVYLLYTRRNPTTAQTLILNVSNSIHQSHFNPLVPTVVIAHGWLSNQDGDLNPVLRNAFLDKRDVNVITVDWSCLANTNYAIASDGVPDAGRALGEFLKYLNSLTGASYDTMHLVGFCLGAHLVGNAGRSLGGNVARITGLDPAGPLWGFNYGALRSNDAMYVEVIHTDGGYTVGGLGIGNNIGDADFFPNGGVYQPGCTTNICNHNRAWKLFAASVKNDHLTGKLCSSTLQISLNNCNGAPLNMGNDDLTKWAAGRYRVNTEKNSG